MIVYSSLLLLTLLVTSPWWLWRMAVSGRYRAGLSQRLGIVPHSLDETIARRGAARGLLWLHAVSVGEVLAAQRLVAELQTALPDHLIVVSTTTETGQQIAREKLGGVPVFYYPLDLRFAVRRYLRALRPTLFVTVESEFWPRMLVECDRAGIPVAVVNARISDRSFPRYMRLRKLWKPLLAKVSLFLAQGEETADRLRQLGIRSDRIHIPGNLKYDSQPRPTSMVETLEPLLRRRKLVVAGSLLEGEEAILLGIWHEVRRAVPQAALLLAPRHPQRFESVIASAKPWERLLRASTLQAQQESEQPLSRLRPETVLVLDTLGDLATVYSLASVAFLGGSMVPEGGHNPLEPARFGVPVAMGDSYNNFREIVEGMIKNDAIRIVSPQTIAAWIVELIQAGEAVGERGRLFFESLTGATGRTVEALTALVEPRA